MDQSSTEREARTKGAKLIKLLGAEWKLIVHENMGWHYCAQYKNLPLRVYGSDYFTGKVKYSVLFGDYMNSMGGSYLWLDRKSYDDPRDAVKATFKLARAKIIQLNDIVTRAENANIWEMETKLVYKNP